MRTVFSGQNNINRTPKNKHVNSSRNFQERIALLNTGFRLDMSHREHHMRRVLRVILWR